MNWGLALLFRVGLQRLLYVLIVSQPQELHCRSETNYSHLAGSSLFCLDKIKMRPEGAAVMQGDEGLMFSQSFIT